MDEDSITFSPRDSFQSAMRYWWVIAALGILGGLLALGISEMRKPVYETAASMVVTMDYSAIGILPQASEDLAMKAVMELLIRGDLVGQAFADVTGNPANPEQLKAFQIERKSSVIYLRVRDTDNNRASELANRWLRLGLARLNEAVSHANAADELGMYIRGLASCLEAIPVNAATPQCAYSSAEDLQSALASFQEQKKAEESMAYGLAPFTQIGVDDEAAVPSEPARLDRGSLVFSGTLIGILLGIIFVMLLAPNKKVARNP